MSFKLPEKLVFVDVETTGTNPRFDRIIDIAIIRVEHGEITQTLNTLVNPQTYLPPEITEITGIIQKDLDRAPLFDEVISKVTEILDGAVFVAHNARFDYAFMKHELKRRERKFRAKTLCTVKLSRKLFPEFKKHNLDAIIERFNFSCEQRHRAYPDALVLWDFYRELNSKFQDKLADAVENLLGSPSLPSYLKKEEINSLPEGPGVYVFYDENGLTLYIGKSVNIRDRVKSHFVSDYQTSTDMKISQNIRKIETIETAGEIGAFIREANLIKINQPLYNRRLRRIRNLTALVKIANGGYSRAEIVPFNELEKNDMENVLGLFPTLKQAKERIYAICEENELCPKMLGLENSQGSCFNYQIEKCKGACVGKEDPLRYNLRFSKAFASTRIKRWPFSGPVGLEEEILNKKEMHVVNNWCYLGSVVEQENQISYVKSEIKQFDMDIYKILKKSFGKKPGSSVKIKILSEDEIKNLLT